MGKQKELFRFHKNDTVGAPAAEDDNEYLQSCFVDTGDAALLESTSDRRIILLGRTGTGKSALIKHLTNKHAERVIVIKPDDLALDYIANSTILNYFEDLGINLDPFYKLLWRHVITVEILNHFFDQHSNLQSDSLIGRLRKWFPGSSREDKEMQKTIDYLEDWGKDFWKETEYRVKEITTKIEKTLESSANATLGNDWLKAGIGLLKGNHLSEEQKTEVVNRAQAVVSQTQVKDLKQVSLLLEKVLADKQKNYYVVVDSLDENWVENKIKYKLIMGLLLTAREFIPVANVKIIIALRRDLIDRVFRLTRGSGFQEEKYQGLYLPLVWTKQDILHVLDRRVLALVSRRYTKKPVAYTDLLPLEFKGKSIGDFIFSIANKPRDVIALFNTSIHAAVSKSKLGSREFAKAVGEYSRGRLRALGDEWNGDYPHLLDFADVLGGRSLSFKVMSIDLDALEEMCLAIVAEHPNGSGGLFETANNIVNNVGSVKEFRISLLQVFYRIGLVGLKTSAEMSTSWADDTGQSVTRRQIDEDTSVVVASKYASALGIKGNEYPRK